MSEQWMWVQLCQGSQIVMCSWLGKNHQDMEVLLGSGTEFSCTATATVTATVMPPLWTMHFYGKILLRPPTTVPQWEWTLSTLGTPITAMMCVSTQEAVRVSAQWGTAHSPQLVDCLRVVECYLIAHVHACYVDSCSVSYFRKLGCTDAEWFQLF